MEEANVEIINELKKFMEEVVAIPIWPLSAGIENTVTKSIKMFLGHP